MVHPGADGHTTIPNEWKILLNIQKDDTVLKT